MNANRYTSTVNASGFSNAQFQTLRVGQWVNVFGSRGQYLGITRAGVVVVNYKTSQGEDMKNHIKANKPLRGFAKLKGK
jgi:hypothetical protein